MQLLDGQVKTEAALHPSIYELSCGVDAVILSIAEEEGDLGANDSWSVGHWDDLKLGGGLT